MTTQKTAEQKMTRTVNSQITDAITQSNALVTGMAPAHSMATLYQTLSQSAGTALQNSVSNQQNVNTVSLAALTQNLQLILQPVAPRPLVQMAPPIIVQQSSSPSKVAAATNSDEKTT